MPRLKAIPKRVIFQVAESVQSQLCPSHPSIESSPASSSAVSIAVLADSLKSSDSDHSSSSSSVATARSGSSSPSRRTGRAGLKRKKSVTKPEEEPIYCSEVACLLASWVGEGFWSDSTQCIITAINEDGKVVIASAVEDEEACACIVRVGRGLTQKVFNALRSLQRRGVVAVRATHLANTKIRFEVGLAPGFVADDELGAERIAEKSPAASRRDLAVVLAWAVAVTAQEPVGGDLEVGTEDFLAAVKPPGEPLQGTADVMTGEDQLACTLLDFQRHSVRWMNHAESRSPDESVPHPAWIPLGEVFINPRLPGVSRSAVSLRLSSVHGGMLCDEMGLGKTVEVLATVATRPRPSDGQSATQILDLFYSLQLRALKGVNSQDDPDDAVSKKLRREVADLHATYLLQDGYAKSSTTPPHDGKRPPTWLDEYHPDRARAFKEAFGYPESSSPPEKEDDESCCLTCDRTGDADAPWVACDICEGWHHQQCVGYNPLVKASSAFICLNCLHCGNAELLPVAATLVVVPASLLQQWVREIGHHAPTMRFVVYTENEEGVFPSLADIVSADIVLVSYPVLGDSLLRTESAEWDSAHALRYRRQSGSSTRTPSALLRVRWWRLIMDEAQMAEGGHSGACRMLKRLTAVNRWAVTGTPLTRGDLRPVSEFLKVPIKGADVKAIQDSPGGVHRLLPLMKKLMWRVWKVDVLDQLNMQGLVQHVVWQELSAVEMFGYRRLEESIRKEAQGSLAKRGASRNAVSYLWDLTRLLQLQCVHQDLRMKQKTSYTGKRKSRVFTDVKYSTFEQNVRALMTAATNRAEEALRNLVATWNGQAGLQKLKGDDDAARVLYSKVLNAEGEFGTRVDNQPKIHALVHSGASESDVKAETDKFLVTSSSSIQTHSANYYKFREQLPPDSSRWWLVAAPTLQGPMEAAYFQQDLREVDAHVSQIVEALEGIPIDSPPEHLVTESICCAKCRGKGRPGRSCFFCRLDPHFEGYQRVAKLPRFKKIGQEAASGSELFKYFRTIKSIVSSLRSWRNSCSYRLGCFDELRQTRLTYRWPSEGDVQQTGPIEGWALNQDLIVWSPEELEAKLAELKAEENGAEVTLRRNLGHLRFLKTQLPTESEDRPGLELCPVCATEKPTTVCMLPCGHSYCQQCISTLLQRGRGSLRCPECRVFTRRNEIGHIAGESTEPGDSDSSPVPSESVTGSILNEAFSPLPEAALRAMDDSCRLVGEWGTRISSVTLLVKYITETLSESVCVFSKWVPVLNLLGSALKSNHVPFVLWSVSKSKMVERFFDGRVRTLLCPLASAGHGLNLTVASHAILLEPPPKYSQTAQAAARIWRLGQQKEATVWHFVSCRTVEEAMWTLSRRADQEEDAELLRDIFSGLTGERVP